MNQDKVKLIISFIISPISFATICIMFEFTQATWCFIPFISFIISSAYILWFYTSPERKSYTGAKHTNKNEVLKTDFSSFPVSANVLTTWIGRSLTIKEVQSVFANLKNTYEIKRYTNTTYFVFPQDDVEFAFNKTDRLESIFLKPNFYPSNSLPNGILPNMTRNELAEKLGQPAKSGGGNMFMGKTVPNHDIWIFNGYVLHVQYNFKDNIDLITLMNPSLVKTA